jgi:short-subunit dehydrogenase
MTVATPERILITGATSAIGKALAIAYAAPGMTLYLHGRDGSRLTEVAEACVAAGAVVHPLQADVRDTATMDAWLRGLDALDLVIVNAGVNAHVSPTKELEPWHDVETILDVNLKAAIAAVHAVLPAMRRRGRGQIALMSSLAGYYGIPLTPTYSASKAGLKAYGEALRALFAPEGIAINVIMPGFVSSPMCNDMPGAKPGLWTPEQAATVIKRRLARNTARISFPFPLNLGTWWLAVVPAWWSQRLITRDGPKHG